MNGGNPELPYTFYTTIVAIHATLLYTLYPQYLQRILFIAINITGIANTIISTVMFIAVAIANSFTTTIIIVVYLGDA